MKKSKNYPKTTHIPEETLSKREEFRPKDLRDNPEGMHHKAEEYKPKRSNKPE